MIAPEFNPRAHPDAHHAVTSPGGYEWWYFDAEDTTQNVQLVGILLDGFVFHPGYLRAHARYLRRPTRHAPPRARDYPCAYLAVYENGRLAAQFMTQYPAGSLVAADDRPVVTLGPNRLTRDDDHTYHLALAGTPWKLTPRGPLTLHGSRLSARLDLSPVSQQPPAERPFLSRAMTGADHRWVLAAPHCRFSATVSLTGPNAKTWNLRGLAYHDHNFGTAPLGPGLARWIWGRALFDDACFTFHHAVPINRNLPPETHLLEVTPAQIAEIAPPAGLPVAPFTSRTPLGLAYPPELRLADGITLNHPRVIDPTPFYLRLIYQAHCRGRVGTALCEVAYPHRLRWPILGRMIEMSFDRSPVSTASL